MTLIWKNRMNWRTCMLLQQWYSIVDEMSHSSIIHVSQATLNAGSGSPGFSHDLNWVLARKGVTVKDKKPLETWVILSYNRKVQLQQAVNFNAYCYYFQWSFFILHHCVCLISLFFSFVSPFFWNLCQEFPFMLGGVFLGELPKFPSHNSVNFSNRHVFSMCCNVFIFLRSMDHTFYHIQSWKHTNFLREAQGWILIKQCLYGNKGQVLPTLGRCCSLQVVGEFIYRHSKK